MDNDHAFNSGSVRPSTSLLSELATAGDHFLQEHDPAALGNICDVSSLDYAGVGWTGVVVRARQTAAEELEFENIEALWVTYAANPADPAAEYALAVNDGELTTWARELDDRLGRSDSAGDGRPLELVKELDVYSGEAERVDAWQAQQARDWADQQPDYEDSGPGADALGITADGHAMPSLVVSRGPTDTELEEPADTDSVRQLLTAEYVTWNEAQGLSLGSADEHLFDNRLTLAQLKWVRDFCERWDNNEQVADAARPRP